MTRLGIAVAASFLIELAAPARPPGTPSRVVRPATALAEPPAQPPRPAQTAAEAPREPRVIGHMDPLPSELLPSPIEPPECPGVRVAEWRPTPGREATSGPTPANVAKLGPICKRAIEGLAAFTAVRGPKIAGWPRSASVSVSMMPAKAGFYGEDYRNLNDLTFRFRTREKRRDFDGSVALIWGYTRYEPLAIYLRNDIVRDDGRPTRGFADTLAHEIFHIASYLSGAYQRRAATRAARDRLEEALAMAYEAFLPPP